MDAIGVYHLVNPSRGDISTLQNRGHFYFALTTTIFLFHFLVGKHTQIASTNDRESFTTDGI
jgi:hypothetical protein